MLECWWLQPYTNDSVCVSPNGGVVQRVCQTSYCLLSSRPENDSARDDSVTVTPDGGELREAENGKLRDMTDNTLVGVHACEICKNVDGFAFFLRSCGESRTAAGCSLCRYSMGQAESASETMRRRHQQS